MRNARKHWTKWTAIAAVGLLAAACSDRTPTGVETGLTSSKPDASLSGANTVAYVRVYPGPLSLKLNESSSVVVVALNSAGQILSLTGRTVYWKSSNSGVAKVSPGVVTGVGGGTAKVRVTVDGVTGGLGVTVKAPDAVSSIRVLSVHSTLKKGTVTPFGAAVKNSSGVPMAGYTTTWKSSNPSVAKVDAYGQVTAVGPGSATIIATAGGVHGSKSITVASRLTASAHVEVYKSISTMISGRQRQLFALSYNASGSITGYSAKWTSSNTDVATVDGAGNVTTKRPGIVKITATNANGVTGRAFVIVNKTY